jgi:hypothetical protein
MSYLRVTTRLRALPAVAAIAIATWPMLPMYAAERHNVSVIGKWRLTSVLDSSEISALDDDEAQQLVGEVLTISKEKVQMGTRICPAPDFEVIQGDTNAYFERRAHASAANLGLPNPVTSVHVSCTYVYIKNPNRLVVHWKGVFFDAVRLGTELR